jgi:excisionase family DNA binding protein
MSSLQTASHDHNGRSEGRNPPRAIPPFDRSFSVAQAAEVLGTSTSTVRRLVRSGVLPHQQVSPRRIVIRESTLRTYLQLVTFENTEANSRSLP